VFHFGCSAQQLTGFDSAGIGQAPKYTNGWRRLTPFNLTYIADAKSDTIGKLLLCPLTGVADLTKPEGQDLR
jgi:hypothetical protein